MDTVRGPNKTASRWLKTMDSSLYHPDEKSKDFLRKATGLADDEELMQHILKESARAMAVSLRDSMLKSSSVDLTKSRSYHGHVSEPLNLPSKTG